MGFYGNITNTARTQFQFDRTYPNRYEMEQKTKIDGVYAGRYILIEYDSDVKFDHMIRVWIDENKFYTQSDFDNATLLKRGKVELKDLVYTAIAATDRPDPRDYKDCVFYKCVGFDSDDIAMFEEVADGSESPAYTVNYNIDTDIFGAGRGYDSTVWQKTYSAESGEKYVMIAELNTVVPTFDVTPDAPTMNPVVPHFDTQSTDVYYKLHWQAPWGFRVRATDPDKSDETTTHTKTTYDPETGKNTTTSVNNIPAAIYYNDAGFAAQVNANRTSDVDINKHSVTVVEDEIRVEPTGKSGNKYNDHTGQSTQSEQFDIQEMTINLPSIGNMMSDAWDIIHGPLRNNARTDANSSLQGRLDSFKEIKGNQIPVKRAKDGTFIGSKINNALKYDNWDAKPAEILADDGITPEFVRDDAWIETAIDTSGLAGGIKDGDAIDQSGNSGISIHHTFHATEDSVTSLDKNTGEANISDSAYKQEYIPAVTKDEITTIALNADSGNNDQIKLYLPYVDAKGHVVGKNIETITLPYSYRFFNTSGATEKSDADLYTTIVESDDGNNASFIEFAESGFIADKTQDSLAINPVNKWIQVKMDSDIVSLAHEIHAVDEVAQSTNLNTDNIVSTNNNDKIVIQDIEFDEAGHVIQNRDHTYTLPYGFKTIKTNGRGDDVDSKTQKSKINTGDNVITTDVVADNTQDELTINSGNKWIRIDTDATSDSITITHDVHSTSSTNNTTDWTTTETNTTIPTVTYTYDDAGHYVSHHTENYKLPFGYGKIKGDSGNTAATATYDEVTFTSDEWLTATVSQDMVTYSHDYPKKVDDTTSESDVNGKGDTIVLETLVRDEKGHVTNVNQNTVTLPYGYKTFTGDSGISSADNTQDTMAVTGDKWVQTTVSDDKIVIKHIGPVSGTATVVSNETPAFGETFTIDDHYFDAKGHQFTSKSHTVKIPQPSLTNGTGNIVTGLSLAASSGAFVETKANLGTIKLGSYEGGDSAADLSADITLQQALSRLQNKIANEVTARQNAIAGLDVTDTAVEGQYVASVSEQDGKITVNRANLPTWATIEQGAKADSALQLNTQIIYGDTTNTVEGLLNMIIDLQARIAALEAQLNPPKDDAEQPVE